MFETMPEKELLEKTRQCPIRLEPVLKDHTCRTCFYLDEDYTRCNEMWRIIGKLQDYQRLGVVLDANDMPAVLDLIGGVRTVYMAKMLEDFGTTGENNEK